MDDLLEAMQTFQRCIEQRDVALADEVLDDDYMLVRVQPDTAGMPRASWLGLLPDYVVHDYVAGHPVIDIDGDLAVVLHRDEMEATVLGEPRNGVFVITDVWRRKAGAWKVWRRHSTPLSAGPMPGT